MRLSKKTLQQEYRYRDKTINLWVGQALLKDGATTLREVMERPGGICIGALIEKSKLLSIRQLHYPCGEMVMEPPARKLGCGEDLLKAGGRELLKRTGVAGKNYQSLGDLYPSPDCCDGIIRFYFYRVNIIGQSRPDEDEFLEAEHTPLGQVVQLVLENRLSDVKTQTTILEIDALLRAGKLSYQSKVES